MSFSSVKLATIALAGALPISLSVLSSVASASATTSTLLPTPLGSGQCDAHTFKDGSVYAEVAIATATCSVAVSVAAAADRTRGGEYREAGYTCTSTREGAKSKWAAAWEGAYYSYSCANGTRQIAFNWGTDYIYDSNGSGSSSQHLLPSPLGSGQCHAYKFKDGSVYAQIAVSYTTCGVVTSVASKVDQARGTGYANDGFTCSSTRESSHSTWASAWRGAYYVYSCRNGSKQIAFNWGTDYTY